MTTELDPWELAPAAVERDPWESASTPAALPTAGGGAIRAGQAVWDWITKNPQEAADIVGQTIGTGVGITGGTALGGPVGGVAGGAAGNVLGKQISRRLMGAEAPDLMSTETAIDAGLGAAGPVFGSTARGTTRIASGLSRKGVAEAEKAGAAEVAALQGEKAHATRALKEFEAAPAAPEKAAIGNHLRRARDISSGMIDDAVAATQKATANKVQLAVDEALETAMGRKVANAALPGAAGALLAPVEPITGALLAAGVGDALLSRALPKLLRDPEWGPRFAAWALNVQRTKPKAAEIAGSFAALAAKAGIETGTKPQMETSRLKPLGSPKRPTPQRDQLGRFVGDIDHTELEALFGSEQ